MPAFRVAFDTGKGGREGSLVLKGADRGKLFFARGEWRAIPMARNRTLGMRRIAVIQLTGEF